MKKIKVVFADGSSRIFIGTKWLVKTELGIVSIENHYKEDGKDFYDTVAHITIQRMRYIEFSGDADERN